MATAITLSAFPCVPSSHAVSEEVTQVASERLTQCALNALELKARDQLVKTLDLYTFSRYAACFGKYGLYQFAISAIFLFSWYLRARISAYMSVDFGEFSINNLIEEYSEKVNGVFQKVGDGFKGHLGDYNDEIDLSDFNSSKLLDSVSYEKNLTAIITSFPFYILFCTFISGMFLHPWLKHQYHSEWGKYLQLAEVIRQNGGEVFDSKDFASLAVAYSYRELPKSLSDSQLKLLKSIEGLQREAYWKKFYLAIQVFSASFALAMYGRKLPQQIRFLRGHFTNIALASGTYALYILRCFSRAKFTHEIDTYSPWKLIYYQPLRARKWLFF